MLANILKLKNSRVNEILSTTNVKAKQLTNQLLGKGGKLTSKEEKTLKTLINVSGLQLKNVLEAQSVSGGSLGYALFLTSMSAQSKFSVKDIVKVLETSDLSIKELHQQFKKIKSSEITIATKVTGEKRTGLILVLASLEVGLTVSDVSSVSKSLKIKPVILAKQILNKGLTGIARATVFILQAEKKFKLNVGSIVKESKTFNADPEVVANQILGNGGKVNENAIKVVSKLLGITKKSIEKVSKLVGKEHAILLAVTVKNTELSVEQIIKAAKSSGVRPEKFAVQVSTVTSRVVIKTAKHTKNKIEAIILCAVVNLQGTSLDEFIQECAKTGFGPVILAKKLLEESLSIGTVSIKSVTISIFTELF